MGKRTVWVVLTVLAAACGQQGDAAPGVHGDDGFAVGVAPLTLLPAPAGLCEGGGSDKECGPEGCVEAPDPTGGGAGSGGLNQNSSGSQPLPSPSSSSNFPSTGVGGVGGGVGAAGFGTVGGTGVAGAGVAGAGVAGTAVAGTSAAGTVFTGGVGGAGGTGAPDAGMCDPLPNGGVSECSDGGVAVAAAALITDDVPACGMTDPGLATKLYMSADDSGSMASPVIARHLIESGRTVPAHVVRPWEFLNYYDFSFEPAAPNEVRMQAQLSSCPQNDRLSLQVALQAEARPSEARAPLTITLVLDTSGSMSGTPIALQRAAVLAIASQLRVGDVVSMITWSTDQADILTGHEVSGPNDPLLLAHASALQAGGGTDLHAGLVRGYELAERYYGADRINRVVLISDGQANVGITDEMLIGMHADDEEGETGVYLAGIGVGDGVNDTLMNVVTDAGRGTYVYLDSEAEAQRMLGDRFLQVVDLAVRNVRLEVTLPYHLVLEAFYGEVASTDASLVRPQHLAPNDAMLFFQVLRACEPALLRGDDRILLRATWETAFTRESKETVVDTTLNALAGDDADLTKGAAIAAYADALIAAASPGARGERAAILSQALHTVRAAQHADTDPDLIEIARLLERYGASP